VVEDVRTAAMLLGVVEGHHIVGALQCLGELAHEAMGAANKCACRDQQIRITS
jgi:hypothetical protein